MKHVKKLLALVLALAMVLSMGVVAFADSTAEHTITVKNINGDNETHSYEAYQVFAGDYADGVLSNVTWGSGVNGETLLAALKASADSSLMKDSVNIFDACTSAADVAEVMAGLTDDSEAIKAISKLVAANLSATKAAAGVSSLTVKGDGYYFVQDVTENLSQATKTNYIMQVCGDVTVTAKSDVPTVVKKVKDVNDSEKASNTNPTDWTDSADYDIGDTIPYQITGTLPSNYATYDEYQYIFSDTMSKGLAYEENNAKIYAVNGETKTEITSFFEEAVGEADNDGNVTVTWSCTDLKAIENVTIDKDTKIVVEYSCELNTDAVLGSAGNPNTVTLKYSNNPNNGGDGTSETPEDKNIVFTYKVEVNKVDGNNKALTGADFKLYKEVPTVEEGDTQKGTLGSEIKDDFDENIEASALEDDKYYVVVGQKTGDSNGSTFEFNGVDDGNYVLVETTVPSGYNAWKSAAVTVSATHTDDTDANDALALTELEGGALLTGNVSTGILKAEIINESGSTLPETGGMGTTILYIVGAILVLGAGVVLVSRKRVSAK